MGGGGRLPTRPGQWVPHPVRPWIATTDTCFLPRSSSSSSAQVWAPWPLTTYTHLREKVYVRDKKKKSLPGTWPIPYSPHVPFKQIWVFLLFPEAQKYMFSLASTPAPARGQLIKGSRVTWGRCQPSNPTPHPNAPLDTPVVPPKPSRPQDPGAAPSSPSPGEQGFSKGNEG